MLTIIKSKKAFVNILFFPRFPIKHHIVYSFFIKLEIAVRAVI